MRFLSSRSVLSVLTALLAAGLLLGGCGAGTSGEEGIPQLEVHINHVLTIGLEEHEHDLLGNPRSVRVDSEGRILIADASIPAVRVYDRDGEWLHDMGRQGEAPGEFTTIHAMDLVGKDTLIVIDGMAMQATLVETGGSFLDSWPLVTDAGGSIMPWSVHPLDGQRHLLEGVNTISTNPADPHPTEVFHYVYLDDGGYQIRQHFFCPGEELGFDGYGMTAPSLGSIIMRGPDEMLYSHRLYSGRLHRFTYDVVEDRWQKAESWEGVVETEQPYESLDEEDHPGHGVTMAGGPLGLFYARVFNQSAGLIELDGGRIAHFTRIQVGEEEQFGVELYDAEGELLGYGLIDRRDVPDEMTRLPYIDWKDEDGRYYILAYQEETGAPVVRVVELEMEPAAE